MVDGVAADPSKRAPIRSRGYRHEDDFLSVMGYLEPMDTLPKF